MMNKKSIYVAVAAACGVFGASQASAATTFASELPSGSSLALPSWAVTTSSYAPTTANPLYLQFALSNGASFLSSTSADLTCSAVNAGATGTLTPSNVQLVAGGVGTGAVTFVVTAITAGALMIGCTLLNNTGLMGTTAAITESVTITYGSNLAPTGTHSTAMANSRTMFTNTVAAETNTALVATGFISFSTAGTNTATTSTARIGSFKLLLNGTGLLSNGNAANANTALTAVVSSITVSIAGTPLASSSGVVITYDSAVGGTAGCGGTKLVSAAGGSSAITFSAISPAAGGATSGYVYSVCMDVSGATIPSGTITVGVDGIANTDTINANGSAYQISNLIPSTSTLGTITRNGSSTEVLNLPPSTNSDAGYLRVYNNSTGSGAVTITVYNEAGTALATTCALSSSLSAQGTLVASVASIETTCGITPPTSGRYRAIVSGAFSSMRAQGLARAGGVLVNLSADSSGNGN